MRAAFITDMSGQDGSYLSEMLLDKGYRVFGLVRRLSAPNCGRIEHIADQLTLLDEDVTDNTSLNVALERAQPDEIYSLAAESVVGTSWKQPILTANVTGLGGVRVFEAARRICPNAQIYQVSSSEMFRVAVETRQVEETPLSAYAYAKVFAHHMAQNCHKSYSKFIANGICFNHESPRRGTQFVTRKITDEAARIEFGLATELRFGDLDAKRNWGYAGDYVEAMWLMLQQEEPTDYIIASEGTHPVREFVSLVFAILGLDWEDHVVVDQRFYRPFLDIPLLLGDGSKARNELNWRPKISFEDLGKMMVEHDLRRLRRGHAAWARGVGNMSVEGEASGCVVSTVVLNWNGKALLLDCLGSLAAQSYKSSEIILVDNGSTDGSVEFVEERFPEVRIIRLDENVGFCKGNNIGIRQAKGQYIALLNNDTVVDSCWLEELVNAMKKNEDIDFCASKILLFDDHNLVDTCGDYYSRDGLGGKIGHLGDEAAYRESREVFGACAGAVMYRRDLLVELDGFDEDFFLAHEDTDLSFRAQLRGYRCLYVPTAIVYHHLSATIGADSSTYIYYGHRNAEYVYIKNMPGPLLWRSLPAHLLLNLALFFFYLRRRKAGPFAQAKLDAIRALPMLLRKRHDIQRERTVSTEYISGLLEENWLRQAVRKKLKRWVHRLVKVGKQWGRRTLPYSWKRMLKWAFHQPLAPTSRIPLSPDCVDGALDVWSEDILLKRGLARFTNPDRRTPCVSVIILTHNKVPFTRLCIESVYRNTEYPHFELVVVDNASEDGTKTYLEGLQGVLPNFHVMFNEGNEGFATANNIGIMQSRGDYVVLLNNDTIVAPGWLGRLIRYLEQDRTIGMVGPVTNSAGNEQMIRATYTSLEELEASARERMRTHAGQSLEVKMLGMFCVTIRRSLIDEVGLLDERFELGNFEDDDYSHRTKLCGYKVICAEDVFIHHFGKGTMGDLGDAGYLELFARNRRQFEQKWNIKWRPHRMRD